jgi:hypothetical protein
MTHYSHFLEVVGNWAAIATAIVAVLGYCKYLCERRGRRTKLEEYLESRKREATSQGKKGQHTILHLISKLGMSESQILEASFQSSKIERVVKQNDDTGFASTILLEWKG